MKWVGILTGTYMCPRHADILMLSKPARGFLEIIFYACRLHGALCFPDSPLFLATFPLNRRFNYKISAVHLGRRGAAGACLGGPGASARCRPMSC
jgi:hypothetical protein